MWSHVPGIGVNVTNQKPTLNLNDVITDFNTANSTNIPLLSIEYVAARVTSEVELLLGKSHFLLLY